MAVTAPRQHALTLHDPRLAPMRAERQPAPVEDALTKALRAAATGDQRRVTRGAAGRAQDQALRMGWLAPVGATPPRLGLTVPGEIELRHRI